MSLPRFATTLRNASGTVGLDDLPPGRSDCQQADAGADACKIVNDASPPAGMELPKAKWT
ncbi:MAG: hypothetical protein U1G07_00250 [Verrucomicrobiota bacterium]